MDKILLTGVCYIHRLLHTRFGDPSGVQKFDHIRAIHPKFDINKVKFFQEDISNKFLFTDFHGKYSSIKTEANTLPELLSLYNDKCRCMYVVGATGIRNLDIAAKLKPADYERLSTFWYFMFDQDWDPQKAKQWAKQRDKSLMALFQAFPKLKFILYQDSCVEWWRKMGLPRDRLIIWNIDWGMSMNDFEEIRQNIIRTGGAVSHRFPTEDSYNELCDMILKDYNQQSIKLL